MPTRIIFIYFILLFASCGYAAKDFNLTDTERKFLAPFKKDDTVYYQSSSNEVDTIAVLGLDSQQKKHSGWLMASPAYNSVYISIKNLPVDNYASVIYGTDGTDTTYNQIISITKYPQQKKVEYDFQFKRFFATTDTGLGPLHTDTIRINGCLITNYFVIKDDVERNSTETHIQQVYWTKNDGLVAYKLVTYKYVNGKYWVKKGKRLY